MGRMADGDILGRAATVIGAGKPRRRVRKGRGGSGGRPSKSAALQLRDRILEAATELFDEMKPYPDIRSRLVGAVRVGQERWNLALKSGATVMLPGQDQESALARLEALQTRMQLLDRPVQVVDLRLTDRVVVRPKLVPPPSATGKDGSKPAADSGAANKHP